MNGLDPDLEALGIELGRAFVGLARHHLGEAIEIFAQRCITECTEKGVEREEIDAAIAQVESSAVAEFDRLSAAAHSGGYA